MSAPSVLRTVVMLVCLSSLAAQSLRAAPDLESIRPNDYTRAGGTLRNGVLSLDLEARMGTWYPEGPQGATLPIAAFAERGQPLQIPSPMIRVPQGTAIRVTIRNSLEETLVVHGLHARPMEGGSSVEVPAGATREVRFDAGAPGTYYYWGSTTGTPLDTREGIDSQLSGAFIVDAPGAPTDDRVFLMGLWFEPEDTKSPDRHPEHEQLVINGLSWPHTECLTYTQGQEVKWRWINPTSSSHPMHLHGFYFMVDGRGDGLADTIYAEPQRRRVVTELMLPGGTMNTTWVPERPGNWVFHCHFGFHVSPDLTVEHRSKEETEAHGAHMLKHHRMAGLVLGIHVEPRLAYAEETPRGEVRKIRLYAQEQPNRYGEHRGLSFIVQEGDEPRPDSVDQLSRALVLRKDEPVAITVVNRLREEPTAVHWHGIELPSFPDGVPNWSGFGSRILAPIPPGESFTAEFTPPRAGTFIYHSHSNEEKQIGGGLYGALLVVDESYDPTHEHVVVVGGPHAGEQGIVNGVLQPEPLRMEAGKTYRLRLININMDWRVTFTLRSDAEIQRWRPVAKDGADLPEAQRVEQAAYLLTGPGETADFEYTPTQPGRYALDVSTQLRGWHTPITVLVSPAR